MGSIARFGVAAAMAGAIGLGVSAPAAHASTANFGHGVYQCASAMLPYDLGPDGSITMTMPGATSPMYFRTFGAMVTFMRTQPMCS